VPVSHCINLSIHVSQLLPPVQAQAGVHKQDSMNQSTGPCFRLGCHASATPPPLLPYW